MSDEIHVFRVWNPEVFDFPPLSDLFEEAISRAVHPTDPDDARSDLYPMIRNGSVAPLVARMGTEYRGVFFLGLAKSRMAPQASTIYFYSAGPKAVTTALMEEVIRVCREEGFSYICAISGRKKDRAMERLVKPLVGEGEVLGTAYRFRIPDE